MKLVLILITSITIVACSGYNAALKSDDFAVKFDLANELFESGEELRAIALYEQIYQRVPNTAEGELAYFRIGKGYYLDKDYYMAGYYFGQFAKRFPSSVKAEEALFLSAMCSVSNSPNYTLDQEETELAINDLQQFVDRYPKSNLIDSCNNVIDRLRFKLEKKSFGNVKLYSKTENYRAAVSSAQTFIEDYPRSSYLESVYFILVKNSELLYVNSVSSKKEERIKKTIERCSIFVTLFTDSDSTKEVLRIKDQAESDLDNLID